jgi:hypothetical protein
MIKLDLAEIGNEPGEELRNIHFKNIETEKADEYNFRINRKMKRITTIISFALGILIGLAIWFMSHSESHANSLPKQADTLINEEITTNEETLLKNDFRALEMTYYLETGNQCANGKSPRFGICSYNKDYIGQTAIVYSGSGQLIGYFEIYDTGYGRDSYGGKGTIENEECIDIFMESDTEGKEFIKKYGNECYVKIVDAKG